MSVVDDMARRRTTPGTPSKPETGLAEWTSRIKAMQRQVDEDEESSLYTRVTREFLSWPEVLYNVGSGKLNLLAYVAGQKNIGEIDTCASND